MRQALTELGKLRFGEMRVEDALHEIVQTTHAIFDVDGAGLMLADAEHHLRNVAVSDQRLGHLEELQIRHQEGPCISAFDDKQLVGAQDLTEDSRWPFSVRLRSSRGARRAGQPGAVQPGRRGRSRGAVSKPPTLVSAEEELAVLAFTDLAAVLIASMMQGSSSQS